MYSCFHEICYNNGTLFLILITIQKFLTLPNEPKDSSKEHIAMHIFPKAGFKLLDTVINLNL